MRKRIKEEEEMWKYLLLFAFVFLKNKASSYRFTKSFKNTSLRARSVGSSSDIRDSRWNTRIYCIGSDGSATTGNEEDSLKEEKDQRKRLVETDDIKEDDNELNYMVITSVAKKFSVDPHADLLNSDKSYISNILQNRPNIEDNHEELNEKREKVQTMKINMYRRLKIYVDEAKDDMESHLRHQRKLAEHSAKAAARWKRIKLLAEDIEIADDV